MNIKSILTLNFGRAPLPPASQWQAWCSTTPKTCWLAWLCGLYHLVPVLIGKVTFYLKNAHLMLYG